MGIFQYLYDRICRNMSNLFWSKYDKQLSPTASRNILSALMRQGGSVVACICLWTVEEGRQATKQFWVTFSSFVSESQGSFDSSIIGNWQFMDNFSLTLFGSVRSIVKMGEYYDWWLLLPR